MKTLNVLGLLLLTLASSAFAQSSLNKIKVSNIVSERMTESRTAFYLVNAGDITGRLICDSELPIGYEQGDTISVGFLTVAYGTELQVDFTREGECNEFVDEISAKLVNGSVVVLFDNEQILSIQN